MEKHGNSEQIKGRLVISAPVTMLGMYRTTLYKKLSLSENPEASFTN